MEVTGTSPVTKNVPTHTLNQGIESVRLSTFTGQESKRDEERYANIRNQKKLAKIALMSV